MIFQAIDIITHHYQKGDNHEMEEETQHLVNKWAGNIFHLCASRGGPKWYSATA